MSAPPREPSDPTLGAKGRSGPVGEAKGPTAPIGLRGGLRRLSAGLTAYGIAGLVVALLGLVALGWSAGRVAGLADRVDGEATQLATTLDRTADTLRGWQQRHHVRGDPRANPAIRPPDRRNDPEPATEPAGDRVSTSSSISILGTRPLADAARLFGEMASDLQGLDTRLDLIANDLGTDRDALLRNAATLNELAGRTKIVAERVRTGFIQDGLEDLRIVLVLTILVFVGWTAVPAIGALAMGLWLRRTLVGAESPSASVPRVHAPFFSRRLSPVRTKLLSRRSCAWSVVAPSAVSRYGRRRASGSSASIRPRCSRRASAP